MKITSLNALEVLDSRGNPTVEVDIVVDEKIEARGITPSGASTGEHEALELRDSDPKRYKGQGVLKAVDNLEKKIKPEVLNKDFSSVKELDEFLIKLDGTENKSNLGANAILPLSMAFTNALAKESNLDTYQYIAKLFGSSPKVPRPMFNILNGGAHANWVLDIQEFMVIPIVDLPFSERLRIGSEVFHSLEDILKSKGFSTNVGNEGGFAPSLKSNQEALDFIVAAIEKAGYVPGSDVSIGIDFAASEFFIANKPGESDDEYNLRVDKKVLDTEEWIQKIKSLLKKYPIISIEDPFAEDSWTSWSEFLEEVNSFGTKLEQVVGDDLLVTNTERIKKAIDKKSCNALLVKVNQIGTVTETLAAMKMSLDAGWKNIVSHRSGETEDTFIAHLATGTACGQIKSGAPSRTDRVAKYNELLRIEDELHSNQ